VESGFTAADDGTGTPVRWLPSLRRAAGWSSTPSTLGVAARILVGLKRCGDIVDTHPGFNVEGDDLKVAV
jgi:hypothetical protein